MRRRSTWCNRAWRAFAFGMLCSALPLLAGAADELRIAVSTVPLSTPFFVAEERGLFAAEGIRPRILSCTGGYICLAQALDGKADLATASDLPVMFNSFERQDYAVLASFVTNANDVKLVARKTSTITEPKDLRGKRIGVVYGSSSHYFLDTFLLLNGLDSSAVQAVGLQPEEMHEAIKDRRVDAIAIWEPYAYLALKALGTDAHVLSGLRTYRLSFNLVGLKSVIAERQDEIVKVLRALDHAVAFIRANPGAAQESLKQRLGMDQDFIDWIWRDHAFSLALEQSLVVTLENEARWAIRGGHRRGKVPDYLDLIDPKPLSAVRPGAVSIVK
jgi:ABC-type nitrate/sulfonate/bicarbonate transport system substrate-binding protein